MVNNQEDNADQDLGAIKKRFNKAADRRKWSMIREKIVPSVTLPTLTTGSAFSTLLWAWDYLPPQAQKIGVLAASGLSIVSSVYSLATTFSNKNKSPIISRKDAIKAIYKDIDPAELPAIDMNATVAGQGKMGQQIFDLEKKRIWKKWSAQLEGQPFRSGFGPSYKDNKIKGGLHASVALASVFTATLLGDGMFTKFNDALHWQPPPEPLVYEAWIIPPANIAEADGYLPKALEDAINQNKPITAHEGSRLIVETHERQGEITVNGKTAEPVEDQPDTRVNEAKENDLYRYVISFDGDTETIDIDIDGNTLSILVNIDNPPSVKIAGVVIDEENPSSIEMEYEIKDDYGIDRAELEIGIKGDDGEMRPSQLPSAHLPTLNALNHKEHSGLDLN